eukprot:scaffold10061_cov147-Skeletonema_dohrnii-CCMP3373.AAC.2
MFIVSPPTLAVAGAVLMVHEDMFLLLLRRSWSSSTTYKLSSSDFVENKANRVFSFTGSRTVSEHEACKMQATQGAPTKQAALKSKPITAQIEG